MQRLVKLIMLFAIVPAAAVSAQALGVDWKMYGAAQVGGQDLCFYDANGVTKEADGHIRVWTKCLRQADMDHIDIKKDFNGQILEGAAKKIASYYVPPIAATQDVDLNQAVAITQYEVTADISAIQPQSQIFYELNCSDRMIRELSITTYVNGQIQSSNRQHSWKYVAPETNGANLLTILCPRQ